MKQQLALILALAAFLVGCSSASGTRSAAPIQIGAVEPDNTVQLHGCTQQYGSEIRRAAGLLKLLYPALHQPGMQVFELDEAKAVQLDAEATSDGRSNALLLRCKMLSRGDKGVIRAFSSIFHEKGHAANAPHLVGPTTPEQGEELILLRYREEARQYLEDASAVEAIRARIVPSPEIPPDRWMTFLDLLSSFARTQAQVYTVCANLYKIYAAIPRDLSQRCSVEKLV